MAGGSGERFWPLSRRNRPKQLLSLTSVKTMIEESIDRISGLIEIKDIFIITGNALLAPLRKGLPDLPPENIVAEPFKRNTAPCLALAAAFVAAKYEGLYPVDKISMAVLTADQSIQPEEGFRDTVAAILDYTELNPCLGTIGIPPSRPETGYGYIEVEGQFDNSGISPELKKVAAFREKPDAATAAEFAASGRFLWNSGMFFWRLDVFIDAMKAHLPEVGTKIVAMTEAYKGQASKVQNSGLESISAIFEKFPDISIDYGLMEKAPEVVVAKAIFDWDDIGSWDSLDRFRAKDESGNVRQGDAALVDIRNSIILNASTDSKIKVAGIGLDNFVIVVTDDAVLVCPKDRVQDVKKSVAILKNQGWDEWL